MYVRRHLCSKVSTEGKREIHYAFLHSTSVVCLVHNHILLKELKHTFKLSMGEETQFPFRLYEKRRHDFLFHGTYINKSLNSNINHPIFLIIDWHWAHWTWHVYNVPHFINSTEPTKWIARAGTSDLKV